MPATVGIILLSHPIIHIIYERGEFTALDTTKTAEAISAFALGLPAFVLAKIIIPIFYANGDTKTPLKITVLTLIANVVLNIILMQWFAHVGIALGTAIAAWFNIWVSYKYAKKFGKLHLNRSLKSYSLKILLCSAIMVVVVLLLKYYGGSYFYSSSMLVKAAYLGATVAAGGLTILVCAACLNLHKALISK